MQAVKIVRIIPSIVAVLLLLVSLGIQQTVVQAQQATVLVPAGSVWRYLANGSDQGTAWRSNTFADDAWPMGAAQLGYGDEDEATVIGYGPDANNKFVTSYFRREFTVANANDYASLLMQVKRDDGVVVYLNGTEIYRNNMPTGTVSHTMLASASAADDGNEFQEHSLSPSVLLSGTNVLAVEIHQVAVTSSDVSFDLELSATRVSQRQTLVPVESYWKYLANGSEQGTAWRTSSFNDASWSNGNAQVGYGDGDEATVVSYGPDPNNKYVTTYFRRTFTAANVTAYTQLLLSVRRDDGAVVYLNGSEIWRDNMPAGAVNSTTLAVASAADDGELFVQAALSPALLLEGANVLAVEVHQSAVTSSDLSFDLQLAGSTAPIVAEVVRGPYLQKGTPNSLIVRWRTNLPTQGRVRYGTVLTNLTSAIDESAATTEHSVTISNLQANTTYYYAVGTSSAILSGGDSQHFFTTAPLPGTAKPTRIWVLGDAGTKDANQAAVRNAYLNFTDSRGTDVWLMLGDNAYDTGTDAEYQAAVFEMYPQTLRQTVLWSTLGNHETYSTSTAAASPYFQMFDFPQAGEAGGLPSGTENYYSFDYGNLHFVCLDSMASDRMPGSAMLTWLQNDLAANNKAWVIAFWHHPPYTKGSHDSDGETELIQMRQNVLPVLESYGVDLVLTGHSHAYERSYLLDGHYGFSSTLDPAMKKHAGGGSLGSTLGVYTKPNSGPAARAGAVYALAGSAGKISGGPLNHPAMFISLNQLGSLVLDVNGNQLDAKFVRETGAIADSFRIVKGNALPTVNLTSPLNQSSSVEFANLTLQANASDSDGTIAQVDFYQGTTWLGSDTSAPYELIWPNVAAGNYALTARAVDQLGSVGFSGLVNVVVQPAAPAMLTGHALSRTSIRLNWEDNAVNESGYRIERSTNGLSYNEVGTVGPNVTTYRIDNLIRNTQYHFRVRAFAPGVNSAYSNVLTMYAFPVRELIFLPIQK